jgi:type II secretory pathway pseudopilin PulG
VNFVLRRILVEHKSEKGAKKAGFTIVELLTVMSVIILLISLMVPALNSLRRYAYYVKQKNQFKGIDIALEFFNTEREGYPNSDATDGTLPYCGAMKLAEAMVGQDMLGFNPQSKFYQAGTTNGGPSNDSIPSTSENGNDLYPGRRGLGIEIIRASIKERKELYLPLESANAYKIGDLYLDSVISSSPWASAADLPVLCDVYTKVIHKVTGKNVGMPILYYKANTNRHSHDFSQATIQLMINHQATDNIYNFMDNNMLVCLGIPTEVQAIAHPMASVGMTDDGITPADPAIFYKETWNQNLKNITGYRPYRADSYILMSAGFDGLYGTKDDVFNFEK